MGVAVWAAAATALAVAGLTAGNEGYVSKAAPDPVGIRTACYGETEQLHADPSYVYSKGECMELLRLRMKRDYAPRLASCMPGLVDDRRLNASAALLDASYNAGWGAVCAKFSSLLRSGGLTAVCRALPGWYVSARNRRTGTRIVLRGLVRRRLEERDFCLKDLGGHTTGTLASLLPLAATPAVVSPRAV